MKNIRILSEKGEIFTIFEKACFRYDDRSMYGSTLLDDHSVCCSLFIVVGTSSITRT